MENLILIINVLIRILTIIDVYDRRETIYKKFLGILRKNRKRQRVLTNPIVKQFKAKRKRKLWVFQKIYEQFFIFFCSFITKYM